jgi:CRP/FNR family transcriptional regulator, anaerobic regulatory protein
VTHPDHATTDCENCPLRKLRVFQPLTPAEVEFMRGFKAGELTVAPHTTILLQGSTSPQLFTALSGWGLRYKLLPEGQRQVINFVMPGDLVGLQAGLLGEMQHCVESVTHMKLCVFPRAELMGLFRTMPERGYDVTWLAAREEHFLGDMLATVGQRSGLQRVAWGLLMYYRRAAALERIDGDRVPMPYRQQDLADAFGLSLVHTNKTLRKLRGIGLITMGEGTLRILDAAALEKLANMDAPRETTRPLM